MGEKASLTWQELSGSKDWSSLLEPQLNEDLREYIIQYGEKGQSIVDAFNNEDVSPERGFSRYPMEGFFSNVGLELNHPVKYEVTQFIYARETVIVALAEEVNWIAYVAVAKEGIEQLGRRDILVVWRPTSTDIEALLDLNDDLVPASDIFGENVMVHKGWHGVYTAKDDGTLLTDRKKYVKHSAGEQVLNEVDKQIKEYEGDQEYEISITVVGHGMGGALATLNAMDIVANGHNLYQPSDDPADQKKACQVTVFAFASPKVGDQSFKDLFDTLNKDTDKNLHALRIFNAVDIVPNLPPVDYVHVGKQLVVDSRISSHLKSIVDLKLGYLQLAHQLEPLLHVVAGWKGRGMGFDPKFNRDRSLVNKDMDALADKDNEEVKAPASWWVVRNKGMAQNEDGSWALDDYIPPSPQF